MTPFLTTEESRKKSGPVLSDYIYCKKTPIIPSYNTFDFS